jgi:hypothetical protein
MESSISQCRVSADGRNGQEPALSDNMSKLTRDATASFLSNITCRLLPVLSLLFSHPFYLFIPLPLSLYLIILLIQLHHPWSYITVSPYTHPLHLPNLPSPVVLYPLSSTLASSPSTTASGHCTYAVCDVYCGQRTIHCNNYIKRCQSGCKSEDQ